MCNVCAVEKAGICRVDQVLLGKMADWQRRIPQRNVAVCGGLGARKAAGSLFEPAHLRSSLLAGRFFEFLQSIAKLIAGDTQQFGSASLVAVAALEGLSHQGHLYIV